LARPAAETPPRTGPRLDGTPLADPIAAFFIYLVPIAGPLFALVVSPYKEREVLRFHAWQSIFFCVLYLGINVALAILTIPFTLVGLPLGAGLIGMTQFAAFLAWIYLLFQAVTNRPARLPYIAELADEQARKR
jgi:uncharacterized membrane protein